MAVDTGASSHRRDLMARLRTPLACLILISILSLGLRLVDLGGPCNNPCNTSNDHAMVFDEVYYVNAARIIDGYPVPAGQHYQNAPSGEDPNAEHPQLGKVMIAGSMRVFGDNYFGWRFPSLVFGSLALLLLYLLVRGVGGSPWLGVGATALMAFDNLLMVHSRIATLDIFVLTFMLASACLYVRGRYWTAGIVLGVGACVKLVAPYLLLVFLVLEVARRLLMVRKAEGGRWSGMVGQLKRLVGCTITGAGVYLGLLWLLDRLVPAYDFVAETTYRDPFSHTSHMLQYAAQLTGSPTGIASYAWGWFADFRPISYLNRDVPVDILGHQVQFSWVHFLGFINPAILLVGVPGLVLSVVWTWRRGGDLDLLSLAWVAGTYIPFLLASLVWHRISYLYYMVVVMPGVYLAAARVLSRLPRWALWTWIVVFAVLAIGLFPFVPTPDLNWA
jgi:dolichyl-phosphate-mannose-protein mannosyltransferase